MEGMGGGMAGSIEKWAGGATAHGAAILGEMTPAAKAQRKEFKKARERLRSGTYGFSAAQTQGQRASANAQVAAQQQSQQADIARAQAGGMLSGGAATEAQRAVAQQALAANAQTAAAIQAESNAYAQAQHAADQARVDAQAQRARGFHDKQANISMQTTGAGNSGIGGGGGGGGGKQMSQEEWQKLMNASQATSAQGSTGTR